VGNPRFGRFHRASVVLRIPSNKDLLNHFRFALPFFDSLSSGQLHQLACRIKFRIRRSKFSILSARTLLPALAGKPSRATGTWNITHASPVVHIEWIGMYFWTRSMLSESSRCGQPSSMRSRLIMSINCTRLPCWRNSRSGRAAFRVRICRTSLPT